MSKSYYCKKCEKLIGEEKLLRSPVYKTHYYCPSCNELIEGPKQKKRSSFFKNYSIILIVSVGIIAALIWGYRSGKIHGLIAVKQSRLSIPRKLSKKLSMVVIFDNYSDLEGNVMLTGTIENKSEYMIENVIVRCSYGRDEILSITKKINVGEFKSGEIKTINEKVGTLKAGAKRFRSLGFYKIKIVSASLK